MKRVESNCKYNFLDENYNYISNEWFDYAYPFDENGFSLVMKNRKWTHINKNGEPILDKWFNYCDHFYNGFTKVEINKKYNFLTTKGKFVFEEWFDWIDIFDKIYTKGFLTIKLNGKYNWVDKNYKLVSDIWFDDYFDGGNYYIRNEDGYDVEISSDQYLTTEHNGETYLITDKMQLFKQIN